MDGAAEAAAADGAPPAVAPAVAPTVAPPAAPAIAPPVAAPVAPPEPAWRRNAEAFDARGAAPVAVALSGLDDALLARALALGAPLTLLIDPAAPGAGAQARRARAAGREVASLGAVADARAVGVAATDFDARALARAGEQGLLALTLTPGAGAAAASGPVAAATFRLDAAASAERVFQTLQEAARRAAPEVGVVGVGAIVALEASDAALTGIARWLAVTQAAPAPLSAVATHPRP